MKSESERESENQRENQRENQYIPGLQVNVPHQLEPGLGTLVIRRREGCRGWRRCRSHVDLGPNSTEEHRQGGIGGSHLDPTNHVPDTTKALGYLK